jgi:vancomycin resistance protein YoaR
MIANKRKFGNSFLLIFFPVIIILAAFSFIFLFVSKDKKVKDRIYPNVYIDNQNSGYKSKKEIIDYFNKKSTDLGKTYLTVIFDQQPVATFSGETLNLKYDGETVAERAYLIARSTNFTSKYYQKLLALFNLRRFDFKSEIQFDDSPVKDFIDSAQEKYNLPAKNALFKFENGKVVSFRKEENGLEIETDLFLKNFDQAIGELKKNPLPKKIILTSKIIKPELTLSQINSYGIEELLAEGKSNFSHSIPERIHNLTLAASKFNGVLIPKNTVFSFNETVGDISSLTGYQPAYIIKEGKTVLGDGGGVCQVSTTLFRAALNAGLPIIERHAHAYRVGYYENDSKPGFDATVFAPSVDLKIKNNTPAYILIQTEIDQENNLLYFRFFGKKDNRKIEISPAQLYDVTPPLPAKYQDDPTLKKGVVKQVDFPAWGGKAYFTYKVYLGDKLETDDKFFSNFRPWAAVYLVGTAE